MQCRESGDFLSSEQYSLKILSKIEDLAKFEVPPSAFVGSSPVSVMQASAGLRNDYGRPMTSLLLSGSLV